MVQGLLDKFVAEFPPDPKEHPRERVDLYKLFTVVLQVRLATALGSSEMAMDKLLPQFRYLVESCRQILEFDVFEDPTVLGTCSSFIYVVLYTSLTPFPSLSLDLFGEFCSVISVKVRLILDKQQTKPSSSVQGKSVRCF